MALEGSWELALGLGGIHKEEAGNWARSFVSLVVVGLEGNVIVDLFVGKVVDDKAADKVANSLDDSDIGSLTSWFLCLGL